MFHDHHTLKRVSRKMRAPDPVHEAARAPSLPELIERIEAALAARAGQPR